MDEKQLRNIFERFQNLNLVALIEDLKRARVACGHWVDVNFDSRDRYTMCPLAHSVNTVDRTKITMMTTVAWTARCLGITESETMRFVTWWDRCYFDAVPVLTAVLRSIYRERLEDADAVQEVTAGQLEAACA